MPFPLRKATHSNLIYFGLAIWSICITGLLYGTALNLPFFFDDLDLLPFVARTPLETIWQTSGSFPYFRPLTMSIWRLFYLIFGEMNSTVLHAVNLLLHSLNGWLVGYIGGWLFRPSQQFHSQTWRGDVAWLSCTLFLIFPFSFQAVPWVSSLSHLLVITLLLGGLMCFVLYSQSKHRGLAFLSLLFTFLAPLAHENGVMVLPLIAVYAWTHRDGENTRVPIWHVLIWLVPVLLWYTIWSFAPKTKSELIINGLEAIMQNAAYFGQGIAYPFTWVGGWLRDQWGWNDLLTAVGLTFLGIAFLVYVQAATVTQSPVSKVRRSAVRWIQSPLAFPWYWCLFTILPALLLLSFNYTISGPRLLLVPSVGISWLWGYTFSQLWRLWRHTAVSSPANRWHRLAGLAGCMFLILIVGQNIQFVSRFVKYHSLLGNVTNQGVAKVVMANENDRTAILINFPNEVRGHTTTYPLGHEGVLFLVDYLREQQLIDVQTGYQTKFDLLRYNDLWTNERPYAYGLLGEGQSWSQLASNHPTADVYLTNYSDDTIKLELVGQLQPAFYATSTAAIFSDKENGADITLVDGCFRAETDGPQVELVWQIDDPPSLTSTIYVHVLNSQNQLVAQKDGFAFGGTYQMGEWKPNTLLKDIRFIPFTGEYASIYVGLYNWITGERLQAILPDNHPLPETGYRLPMCAR